MLEGGGSMEMRGEGGGAAMIDGGGGEVERGCGGGEVGRRRWTKDVESWRYRK